MTPSEELREAAKVLLERAEKATTGPWGYQAPDPGFQSSVSGNGGEWVAECGPVKGIDAPDGKGDHDARWIATANPALARPIAAMLEYFAGLLQWADDWTNANQDGRNARELARLIRGES